MGYRVVFASLWCLSVVLFLCYGRKFTIKEKQGTKQFVGNVIKTALPYYLAQSGKSLTSEEIDALRYKFFGKGNPNVEYFSINERTGNIITRRVLNRDVLCPIQNTCELHIDVAAFNSENLVQIMRITVIVEDINDHWPEFPQSIFDITIPESAPVNSTFPVPSAKDPDAWNNTVQRYLLAKQIKEIGLRVMKNLDDSTDLAIVVNRQLDRETAGTYKLEILAIDGGIHKKTGTMTVVISVADINDNRPVFSKTRYNVTVKEDLDIGETLTTVVAHDKDSGDNGKVSYSFSKRTSPSITEKFTLNAGTGVITLQKKLDYETDRLYQLLILATDHGSQTQQTSQALVIINVVDVNDNKPVINFNFLSNDDAKIAESAKPGKFVAHVSVIDADSGENSKVVCSLKDDRFFRIDDKFQIYSKKTLNREEKDSYDVVVNCHDKGNPQLSSSAKFVVKVLDENDNAPEFIRDIYYVSIYENNAKGEVLLQVTATDKDIGSNRVIRYSIEKDTYGWFKIDSKTGVITVENIIDRETINNTSLFVVAKDMGTPSLSSMAKIEVTILDINDVKPYFDPKSLHFDIPEGIGSNGSVGFVKAYDNDLGNAGKFDYLLRSYDGKREQFLLSPDTGELIITRELDREEISEYHLTVVAKDRGDPSLTGSATVTISVLDKNDNLPIFDFPSKNNHSVEVKTTYEKDHVVCRLKAKDLDEGRNGMVSFKIESNPPRSHFSIDSNTGVIRLIRKFQYTKSATFSIVVSAHDHGNVKSSTYSRLVINVTFVNTSFAVTRRNDGSGTDDRSRENDNVAIVVGVVIVTLVLVIVLTVVIYLVVRQRRMKRPEIGEDSDLEFSNTAQCDPDVVKSNGSVSNSFQKRGVNGNADFIMDGKLSSDVKPSNGYLNSYDPTHSLSFLWTDSQRDSAGSSQNLENKECNLQHNSWKDIVHDAPSNRDDASDVSENTVTSDSGRGGSDEGSARGHLSMEENDHLAALQGRFLSYGDYVDMSGGPRRAAQPKTSTPLSDQQIAYHVAALPRHLGGYGRCSSDQNLVIGRLTPIACDQFVSIPPRYTQDNRDRNVATGNEIDTSNCISNIKDPLCLSNSLDRPNKLGHSHGPLNAQLSAPVYTNSIPSQTQNPYSDFTSSSQLACVNSNNNNNKAYSGNEIPGILSKRTHGSMPIRFKKGLTPHSATEFLRSNDPDRHSRAQKCVRFETFVPPSNDIFSSPLSGSYDDDDTTTTSGSYNIDADDLCEREDVTNV